MYQINSLKTKRCDLVRNDLLERIPDFDPFNFHIYYSPFSRTQETAQEIARVIGIETNGEGFNSEDDLRERYFGDEFELETHDNYHVVWEGDTQNPHDEPEGPNYARRGDVRRILLCRLRPVRPISRVASSYTAEGLQAI
eukprot:jgi/Botrbrau1/20234/Bobra.31_1s0029.3